MAQICQTCGLFMFLSQFLIRTVLRKPGESVQEANVQKHIKHARLCGRYVGERRGRERRGVIL